MDDLTVKLVFTADGRAVIQRAGEVGQSVRALGPTAQQAGQQIAAGMDPAARGIASVRREAIDTSATLSKLVGVVAGGAVFKGLIGGVVDANNAMKGFNAGLKAAFNSQTLATEAMSFTRAEADRLGLGLRTTSEQYTALSAAARGTALEGEQSRRILSSVSEAARVLNLSSEKTAGALGALEQMISKGNVQAEELRGQLGERLPGAFSLAAKAMGVTTQQLNKMLDDGKVLAADLLPKLATELHKLYGAQAAESSRSSAAEFERLKNAVFELQAAVGDAGVMDVLTAGARALTATLNALVQSGALPALVGGLSTLVLVVGTNYVAGLAKAAVATHAANSAMAEMALGELRLAQAAETAAAAELAKARALEAGGVAAGRVATAQAALAAAHARTAAALEVSTAAAAANTGMLARFGSGALALVGGPIGALIIALGALSAAIYSAVKAENERTKVFAEGVRNLQQATQATRELIAARQQLAGQPQALGDVVRQEATNVELLTAKTRELEEAQIRLRDLSAVNTSLIARRGIELPEFARAKAEVAQLTTEIGRLRNATDDLTAAMRARLLAFLATDLPAAARDAAAAVRSVYAAFSGGDAAGGLVAAMRGVDQVLAGVRARFLDADKAGVAAFQAMQDGAKKAQAELDKVGKSEADLTRATVQAGIAAMERAKMSAEEIAAARKVGEQWIKTAAGLDAAKNATKLKTQATKELRAELSDLHELERQRDAELMREADISARARRTMLDMIADLQFEATLIGKTSEERERAILLRQAENALKDRGSELSEEEAKSYLAEIARLQDSNTAHQRYADQVADAARRVRGYYESMADSLANAMTRGGNLLQNLGRALVDTLRQIVNDMIAQWLRTRIIGMFMGGGGGGWGALASMGMSALSGGGGNSGGSFVNAGVNIATGGSGNGFDLSSPSSWMSAGRSLWNGFMNGFTPSATATSSIFGSYSGAFGGIQYGPSVGSPLGLVPNYGAGAPGVGVGVSPGSYTYTPSPLGYGVAIAGGAIAGYNRYQNSGGGAAGVAGGLAYGVGTTYATLGVSAALSGGLAAGLAAIPVVGWIALAAMLIDKFAGGKLFGTAFKPEQSTQSMSIGPEGASAGLSLSEVRQRSLFRGRQWRLTQLDVPPELQKAAEDFYKQISKIMTDGARQLAIDVPPMIDATLRTVEEYDKNGKVKATKYFVDTLGRTWEEASAELAATRVSAEAIVATVAASEAGRAASAIAEQWRGSAEELLAGAQFLLAASVDMEKGRALLGEDATLEATVALTQELSFSNESLIETYARLRAETQVFKDALRSIGVTLNLSGEEMVRFADEIAQAFGGVEQAQSEWQQFISNFGADGFGLTEQLATLQEEALDQLSAIGFDSLLSLDDFEEKFKAALPTLSADEIVQWIRAGNALADATRAQESYTNALEAYQQFSDDLAQSLNVYQDRGQFGEQMRQIDSWRTDAIAQANQLARAAGLAAASERDLANIELRAAQLRAQAYRQLEVSTQDLIARLYGGPAGSLDALNAQIAAMEAAQQGAMQGVQDVADASNQRYEDELAAIERIRGFLNSLLLNTQLTTLTPEQQLAEARRQYEAVLARARGGDVDALAQLPDLAQALLERGRGLYSSGDEYDSLFASVTQALSALGVRSVPSAGSGTGGGGVVAITASPQLQALYERRDELLAEQERQTRLAMAQQLAIQLQQMAADSGRPVIELARSLGVKIDEFISDLGINLEDLTVATTGQLADLAATLGISLVDLANEVGFSLGDLADQNSLINDLLEQRIQSLPAAERALLEPLFRAVEEATNEADANAAINALRDRANGLPAGIRDLLAPILGLPASTTTAISGTATATNAIAESTSKSAEASYWNGMSIGFQNDVTNASLVQVHSRLAEIRDAINAGPNAAGSAANSYGDAMEFVNEVAALYSPSDAESQSDGEALRAITEELVAVRKELAALRAERVRGDDKIADSLEAVADATTEAAATAAREQRRLVERMGTRA
jgi:tape measure domain-containing protein